MTLSVQAAEVIRWCRQLAKLSEDPTSTTRPFLSRPMRDVHTALAQWMSRVGMRVRVDAAGNIRGTYPSASGDGPAVRRLYLGSHLDTVPNAGAFDGVLGVVLSIALMESLAGRRFAFAIEVVGFSDEEGVRFGVPFLGSRALAGTLDTTLLERRDEKGHTISDAIKSFGLDPKRISDAAVPPHAIGYFEFHIEQGPVLEALNLPLAVVDVIAGQARYELAFSGSAGHAGTSPMNMRHDALAGAAEWIVEVERYARNTVGLVATVGRLSVEPGVGNVIPARAILSLDVRHAEDDVRNAAVERLIELAREIAHRRALGLMHELRLDQDSVAMAPSLAGAVEKAIERAGYRAHHMTSGAGHDAMVMAGVMPAAMMFLRCAGGVSHHPDESVREDDVAAALEAGRKFLEELETRVHG